MKSQELINYVENMYPKNNISNVDNIKVGDFLEIKYNSSSDFENKTFIELYEGILIAINNKGNNKSITIRRNISGVDFEQIIPIHSPRIMSLNVKQSSKVRRSKLFFIRNLSEKKIRNKLKF